MEVLLRITYDEHPLSVAGLGCDNISIIFIFHADCNICKKVLKKVYKKDLLFLSVYSMIIELTLMR